jgi:hypothetical protein
MIATTYEQTEPASHEISIGFDSALVGEVESAVDSVMFKPAYAKLRWTGFDLNNPTYLHIGLGGSTPQTQQRFFELNIEHLDAGDGQLYSFEHAPEWVVDLVILRPGVGKLVRDYYDAKGWKQP